MSFRDHDKKTFIADTARAFADTPHLQARLPEEDGHRRRRLLGLRCRTPRQHPALSRQPGLLGTEALAQDASVTQWLKDVGAPFKGTKIRYTSEATPPTVVLDKLKNEFTEPTGIEVEIEIVPLEQVLAKATQDVQGQLGTYDSTTSTSPGLRPSLRTPSIRWPVLQGQAGPGHAGLRLRRLLQAAGRRVLPSTRASGSAFPSTSRSSSLMYRKDILEKHGIAVADHLRRIHRGDQEDHRGREGQRHLRHRPPGQVGPLLAELRLDPDGVERRRLDLRRRQEVHGQRRSRRRRPEAATRRWLKNAPPQSTNSTWDGQFQMMAAGQCALVQSWDEFFPGLDADDSKVKGLWMPAKPLVGKPLRPLSEVGFGEIPNYRPPGRLDPRPVEVLEEHRRRPGSSCSGPARRTS